MVEICSEKIFQLNLIFFLSDFLIRAIVSLHLICEYISSVSYSLSTTIVVHLLLTVENNVISHMYAFTV